MRCENGYGFRRSGLKTGVKNDIFWSDLSLRIHPFLLRRVLGVSLIKLIYFDSCLVFLYFDILSLIKKKNILSFSVSF